MTRQQPLRRTATTTTNTQTRTTTTTTTTTRTRPRTTTTATGGDGNNRQQKNDINPNNNINNNTLIPTTRIRAANKNLQQTSKNNLVRNAQTSPPTTTPPTRTTNTLRKITQRHKQQMQQERKPKTPRRKSQRQQGMTTSTTPDNATARPGHARAGVLEHTPWVSEHAAYERTSVPPSSRSYLPQLCTLPAGTGLLARPHYAIEPHRRARRAPRRPAWGRPDDRVTTPGNSVTDTAHLTC